MKIPKTYKGIPVVIPNKTPKYKKKSGVAATATVTRAGEPVIKVWKEHRKQITPRILNHEVAHIKLGHHLREGAITKNEYYKQEKQAEQYAYHIAGGKGQLAPHRLGHLLIEELHDMPKSKKKWARENPDRLKKVLVKNSSDWGFTKNEMKSAINYLDHK